MDNHWELKLKSAEACVICSEPFDETHYPTALPCHHIFGTHCIWKWLRNGEGDNHSCPVCRYVIIEPDPPEIRFDAPSIWKVMCEQPPHRIHELMMEIWPGVRALWKRKSSGKFEDVDVLRRAVQPAIEKMEGRYEYYVNRTLNPMGDCMSLIGTTWNQGSNRVNGLAVTLVRLAHLISTASRTLPMWLTTHQRLNRVIWEANACIDISEVQVHWNMIMEASKLENNRYFPLLYLYTVLISQAIAHNNDNAEFSQGLHRRQEMMKLVVKRCITKICGESWRGSPSNQFKDVLVKVYEKLRHFQLGLGKMSLRGLDGEQNFVKAIWTLAWWE